MKLRYPIIVFITIILTLVVVSLFRREPPTNYIIQHEPVTITVSGPQSATVKLTKSDYKPTPTLAPGATPGPVGQDFDKTITLTGRQITAEKDDTKVTISGITEWIDISKRGDNLTVTSQYDSGGVLDYQIPAPKLKLNSAALIVGTNFNQIVIGGYIEHDFKLAGPFYISVMGLQLDKFWVVTGLEYRF